MTKRFLIILAMVLWSNVGFAEIIEMKNCRYIDAKWQRQIKTDYVDYIIDIEERKYKRLVYAKPGKTFKGQTTLIREFSMEGDEISGFVGEFFRTEIMSEFEKFQTTLYPNTSTIKTNYWGNNKLDKKYSARLTLKCSKGTEAKKLKKIEMASMIDDAKDKCKVIGFEVGTEKFADCTLKLYAQSVELAAKQNQQIVVQGQSSGSNVMTIYDPVRDSNAAIKRGQGLINGTCTLGDLSNC